MHNALQDADVATCIMPNMSLILERLGSSPYISYSSHFYVRKRDIFIRIFRVEQILEHVNPSFETVGRVESLN